jgi:hypothetical protein
MRSKPTLNNDQIAVRLKTSKQLLEKELVDAGLLVAWTAAEAVFRRLLTISDIQLETSKSSYLIKTLYSNGLVGWRDYELIQKIFDRRNQAAHGFVVRDLDEKTVLRFMNLIEELSNKLILSSTVTESPSKSDEAGKRELSSAGNGKKDSSAGKSNSALRRKK